MSDDETPSVTQYARATMLRIWAGLECGVVAGTLVVVWYALHSALRSEVWWAKFNVAAFPFYGAAVFQIGLSRATLVGGAELMLLYAVCGALFGALASLLPARVPTLALALLYASIVHVALGYALRPLFGYWAPVWFPAGATMPAHLILAAMLARWPTIYHKLSDTLLADTL